ncbi:MAG: hypothetical protein SGI87_09750 [Flavobacteriales bacterium]|nr:hypothetical protein [Flavobacteriales bacterium]
MKNRHLFFGFFAVFLASAFLASCLNEDNKIPPNCYDGILNNGEFLLDCGGPCEPCNHCIDQIFQPELGEQWLDCGGADCLPCSECGNGIEDGSEFGIDCGGTCGPCEALCADGLLNGNEEEVDCGGECLACPTCDDEIINGTELGIDCGGLECPDCNSSGNCNNGYEDGLETYIDCGGPDCYTCDTLLSWKIGSVTHVVLADNVVFSWDGSTLTVGGTSIQNGLIAISIDNPPSGWVNGGSNVVNTLSAVVGLTITYTDLATTTTYGSAFEGSAGNFTIVDYEEWPNFPNAAWDTLKGILRCGYSGTLKDATGDLSISVSQGTLMISTN